MAMRAFFGGVLFLGMAASCLQAASLYYGGNVMPATAGFTQVIFGDTTMSTDGDVLTMTTFPFEGVWFGASSGMDTSGPGPSNSQGYG